MNNYWFKIISRVLPIIGIGIFIFSSHVFPAEALTNLNGRILLQVQDKGQAWYVNPLNSQRYYLGRPDDAFTVMRSLGLGVTNSDLAIFKVNAPRRLAGRILLQVQDKGQAYYVNPVNLKLYYLGRPSDAFNLMRSLGLGISNTDLAKIPVAASSFNAAASSMNVLKHFNFKYQNISYDIAQNLSSIWYDAYHSSPKIYTYYSESDPASLRESFYGLFLQVKSGDSSLDDLITKLRAVATAHNWSNDQLAEFTLALVQFIPYDTTKISTGDLANLNPFYPYETLYLNRGVCSDKTFLALALLRRLGYGAAILDFPDINHAAVGIACPTSISLKGSGYCYVETSNYFPFGVIPSAVNSGQAESSNDNWDNLFNPATLGQIEIYQKTTGRTYYGVSQTQEKIVEINSLKNNLNSQQSEINNLVASLQTQEYNINLLKIQLDSSYSNDLVSSYNNAVNKYNSDLVIYQSQIDTYNNLIANYNQATRDFYQQ